jgi:hypothetical protein
MHACAAAVYLTVYWAQRLLHAAVDNRAAVRQELAVLQPGCGCGCYAGHDDHVQHRVLITVTAVLTFRVFVC